jgi:hypothetical protein
VGVADQIVQLASLALEPSAAAVLQPSLEAVEHVPMMARRLEAASQQRLQSMLSSRHVRKIHGTGVLG